MNATLFRHCNIFRNIIFTGVILFELVSGTSWYSPRYLAAGHLTSYIDVKSLIYILLLNIFSPRVTLVTLVPCLNTTQFAK